MEIFNWILKITFIMFIKIMWIMFTNNHLNHLKLKFNLRAI